MIAKIIKGKDFYGVLAYNDQKVGQGSAHVIDANIALGTTVEKTKIFNAVRALRPNLTKAVLHVSLNLPYEDQLSDRAFAEIGQDYLKGMGFNDNQFIIYRHLDQKHQHIHIIANRIGYSGKVVSDSKDLHRSKDILRALEKKYNLTQLTGPVVKKESPITQKELEKALRTGHAPMRYILQDKVQQALVESSDVRGFIEKLQAYDIHPKFNISKSTGWVSGISFEHQGIIYKGSTLGRGYSWNAIIKQIDYEQDRDRAIVLQANTAELGHIGRTLRDQERTDKGTAQPKGSIGGPGPALGQPKGHMGISKADFLRGESSNSFKNELDGLIWRRRSKKGRRR